MLSLGICYTSLFSLCTIWVGEVYLIGFMRAARFASQYAFHKSLDSIEFDFDASKIIKGFDK